MNIGVDGSSLAFPRTGVGNYIEAQLTTLVQQHPEAQFFVYSSRQPQLEHRINLHLRVEERRITGPVWRNLHLPRQLRRDHIDVFWSGTGLLPYVGLRDTPTVLTICDFVYLFAGETMPWLGRLSRSVFQPRSVRMATRVVAISRATALDLERVCGRAADAIIPPVVSQVYKVPADAEKERIRTKYQLHDPYFFTVGTLEPRKNLASLLAAYDLLRGEGIRPPGLVIAGGKGWRDKELSARLRTATEAGIVRLLGFVEEEDLAGLYGAAFAFIFPSFYEGFGMPLVEAQLCGAPVLYSDRPAMREAAGDFGITFDPTPEGIASAITQVTTGACPLTYRLPRLIPNSAEDSARKMWDVILSASNPV